MRVVFAGTPKVAVPSLRLLLDSEHDVIAVITRPDAPAGRGRQLVACPVAEVAKDAGVRLLQPVKASDPEFLQSLRDLSPDACAVVAYGALIPEAALSIPRRGWVNLHFSLLPAWRGAAPVQHAIWRGDEVTGATTFIIESGLDTGPVLGTLAETIRPDDTAGDLLDRLAESGAHLLAGSLDAIAEGRAHAIPQPSDGVSQAPKLTVDDARIDWRHPARAIERQIRACTPSPGAWTILAEQRVKVFPITVTDDDIGLAPGELLRAGKNVWLVGTATTPVALGDVQPQGKRRMGASDWARGARLEPGEILS
ncbi:MAG: methionyl-tRNA formyltransferase [Candidatus Nanopelagicales bacterium]|nr:methionyl-tRNA formyltransferase [Candidatus Nanopelagicales bacterium]MDZ4250831.1 methionyl-tRNA formyltransferase [Candidatus Nanopelagicales bacterium]